MKYPIPEAALSQHVVVLGKTRSGKSSALRTIVEPMLDDKKPLCIIDPKGDWWGLKLSKSGKQPGYPVVLFSSDYERADITIDANSGKVLGELAATTSEPMLITLGNFMISERTRWFIDFASAYFTKVKGRHWLIIDEVHNFAPKGKIFDPAAGQMLHWANRLASEGLGKGIALLAASQRPQKVHNDFLTSCETLIAKQVIHKADRQAVADWIDGCGDPQKGKEVLANIAQLKRPTGYVWSPEINFGPKLVEFPMFTTFDSFRPQTEEVELKPLDNLDELKVRLASVSEKAKENDPAILKRRIAELEREVRNAPKAVKSDAPPQKLVEARKLAKEQGWQQGYAYGWNECRKQTVMATEDLRRSLLQTVKDKLVDAENNFRCLEPQPNLLPPPAPSLSLVKTPVITRQEPHNNGITMAKESHSYAAHSDSVELPRGEAATLTAAQQKILDKLGWLEQHGILPAPKETLAAVCDVSPTSGGYFNNLGKLRSAGLIDYPSGGMVAFTDSGRQAANAIDDDGREVHEHWLDVVTEPQRKIMQALIKVHPKELTKDELANRIGVSSTSGGYFNNLGKLRTLGAIDYPARGFVALTKFVMP